MEAINERFTEAQLEEAIIELFKNEGYEYVNGEEIHRPYEQILLENDLKQYLLNRYGDKSITIEELNEIIGRIDFISPSPLYEGSRETYRLINEGFTLDRINPEAEKFHVEYIDFGHPENNIFKIVNQYSVNDKETRRPDMLIFINGIPVAIFEFKTAIEENKTIHDAWEQINIRYARDIPKLLKYNFLSVITDGANTRMGTVFTPYEYYYAWNKVNDDERAKDGIGSLLTMIKGAFAKDRIIKILSDYIFYPDDSKDNLEIVCRYPQFFAAEKMLKNIELHQKPNGDGKGGTYFGATGCGKTYTMLFLSRLLAVREGSKFHSPTIIVLVDREDLDDQTSELFVTAKKYLREDDVRSIESREDLSRTLRDRPSGGIYIISIQKFCESTGLLSDRNNIICFSDEAHRTQIGVGAKLRMSDDGVYTSYGFAKYLRDGFPNATYCGFTGTPIDQTLAVFGPIVDSYTMKESCDDGITVRIAYEPRLARVIMSQEQADKIQSYYDSCAEQGSTEEQIEESQRAMSSMKTILGNPDRLKKLAQDIVAHYEMLCAEKPEIVQKAMIVCADRAIAYQVLKNIIEIRPEWGEKKKAENEDELSEEELSELKPLAKINLVATQGANDPEDLYETCGNRDYRKMLDKQFKNTRSNFKIAIVVDMWITGFDVPSLEVMYIDKPVQRHTLIQTISRVNRVFEGKDSGLVVDYIGIKSNLDKAIKQYGGPIDTPIDELEVSLSIFRNELALIDDLMYGFDATRFHHGTPLERLYCLNDAVEFIQLKNQREKHFMFESKRMKAAYQICFPSGELTDEENAKAQFYLAARSILYKQTRGNAPDAEVMNKVVEQMVAQAIACTGVEDIVGDNKSVDLFSDEFIEELKKIKLPITKFNALLQLLKRQIWQYGKINKVKALEFTERLEKIVNLYNNRDKLTFSSEQVGAFIDDLSDQIIDVMKSLKEDEESFKELGITFEEKAFYDILVKVRNDHEFKYDDDKCLALAKKIKELVDDASHYADWSTRSDTKNKLNQDLTVLLYENGYPPEWDEEVFDKVMEQAENFKAYNN
ncbi:type I restriction endonuclease subunit R [Candidatus Saccharibacteria bacterium]|nr:type I restriction endonuclease subunit R [Candidatus Saccharibacteria bacterium]